MDSWKKSTIPFQLSHLTPSPWCDVLRKKKPAQLFSVCFTPPTLVTRPPFWPPSLLRYSHHPLVLCMGGCMCGWRAGWGGDATAVGALLGWPRCAPVIKCVSIRVFVHRLWPIRLEQALKWQDQWLSVCPVYKQGAKTFKTGWPLIWPQWTGSDPKDCYL